MKMEMYHFVTHWYFHAPIDLVWRELNNIEAWPLWWRSYQKAAIRGEQKSIEVGTIVDNRVKGSLPYSLTYDTQITQWEPPALLELKSTGDLVGNGKFMLEARDDGTAVTFYWDVGTSNAVFNLLAKLPFIRRFMEKNHGVVMDDGYRGLRARIEKQGDAVRLQDESGL